MQDQEENLIVGGDLNLILKAEEKRGGNFQPHPNRETLEEIMEQCNLLDIPPKNGKYTWDNRRIGKANIKEMLDSILIQDIMVASYSRVSSKIIPSIASDQKPVLIELGMAKNYKPLPLRYNQLWGIHEAIKQEVEKIWKQNIND